jgi:hypothetical protein
VAEDGEEKEKGWLFPSPASRLEASRAAIS